MLCCALLWLYIDWFSHIHQAYFTGTVPAKQPWWIWINTSCEFIMNDCITTTKQSTTKQCAYFLGYTVSTGPVLRWMLLVPRRCKGNFKSVTEKYFCRLSIYKIDWRWMPRNSFDDKLTLFQAVAWCRQAKCDPDPCRNRGSLWYDKLSIFCFAW